MVDKFELPAGKHCWKLANRLTVMVYLLGLRCWLVDWRIRDATAEVVSYSAAAVSLRRYGKHPEGCSGYRRKDTILAGGYEHPLRYSFEHHGAHIYRLRLFKAVSGQTSVLIGHDRWNIWPLLGQIFNRSPGTYDRWQNLTGHIAYRLFDLNMWPVK